MSDARYSIGELAEKAGVTRRTVRYYVQRGLIPAPLGRGRGEHYTGEHLAAVLRVRSLQEQGASLDEIRRYRAGEAPSAGFTIDDRDTTPAYADGPAEEGLPVRPGQVWVRQMVTPGCELHSLGADNALTERQLAALARFVHSLKEEGNDDAS